ncbi:MAG: hypothetical protein V2J51_03900 [Erythrobacter sp.]|nr:hypothetical protein [Erythrobacter sp.]
MPASERPDPKAIDWRHKDAARKDFSRRANLAFLIKCFGIGFIALLIPISLPLVGGYDGHYSISYFYHVEATRNLFVGLLWAVGVFLILFQGLSLRENLTLSAGGMCLILVAMVPTGIDQCADTMFSWHAVFALSFFACLFIVAVFFAKQRLAFILWPPLRKRFAMAYNVSGCLMIGLPLIAYSVHLFEGGDCGHVIYWIEFAAIAAFSFFWFVKTWEYKRLLGLDIRGIVRQLVS